jgi:hypothetical protein
MDSIKKKKKFGRKSPSRKNPRLPAAEEFRRAVSSIFATLIYDLSQHAALHLRLPRTTGGRLGLETANGQVKFARNCESLVFDATRCLQLSYEILSFPPRSSTRKPLMGGNWKLNPKSVADAMHLTTELAKLVSGYEAVDTIVFPPMPFIYPVGEALRVSSLS